MTRNVSGPDKMRASGWSTATITNPKNSTTAQDGVWTLSPSPLSDMLQKDIGT